MRIRPATEDDVPAVVALEEAVFGVDAWSWAATAEELTGSGRRAVVACDEGGSTPHEGRLDGDRVVGYAVSRVTGDVADLHRIAVVPEHRRSGMARALLEELRRAARADGAARMLLEVAAGNTAALAFYAAEGFSQVDRRPRYYRDGADALVLRGPVGAPACGGAPVPGGASS